MIPEHVQQIIDKLKEAGIKPNTDRVAIIPDTPEQMTKSGLFIPDTAKERPETGWIVAVGTGKLIDQLIYNHLIEVRKKLDPAFEETEVPVQYQVGEHVLFGRHAGTELEYKDIKFIVMRESEIAFTLD
jgi:chaperonin GroES